MRRKNALDLRLPKRPASTIDLKTGSFRTVLYEIIPNRQA
jgi:hypothetical protein